MHCLLHVINGITVCAHSQVNGYFLGATLAWFDAASFLFFSRRAILKIFLVYFLSRFAFSGHIWLIIFVWFKLFALLLILLRFCRFLRFLWLGLFSLFSHFNTYKQLTIKYGF
jgi:hypothetical protein